METPLTTTFFLGSNTSSGFYSLYHPFLTPNAPEQLFLLKGGSVCGRSAFLQRVGQGLSQRGYPVTYVPCSCDPAALDALLLESLGMVLISGTYPHLAEPQVPSPQPRYLDLSLAAPPLGSPHHSQAIDSHAHGYRTCHQRACRCLTAAAAIGVEGNVFLLTPTVKEKMTKRVHGILSREGKSLKKELGHITQRFLGSMTSHGLLCPFDTVDALCQRVYALSDSYGLAHIMIGQLADGFVTNGYDVIACPSPLSPQQLDHLIVPALSLAFVTSTATHPYLKKPYRHIRIDPMADQDLLLEHKGKLRFARKISGALLEEAATSLAEGKAHYERLDALYHPYVNFEMLYQLADRWVAEWVPMPES